MTANIIINTSKILTLDLDSESSSDLAPCVLKWRRKNLVIEKAADDEESFVPAITRKQWVASCLRNSWVKRICIDRKLGEANIKLWADIAKETKKPVFLRIPSDAKLPHFEKGKLWSVKRCLDWLAAAGLLLALSPIILSVSLLIKIFTPGPIFFTQWRVGKRSKLFKIYKFRTMAVDAEAQHHQVMGKQDGLHKLEDDPRITPLGKWLRKYSIDELPQLFNVLRGEMSLVGPRPWALYDALRLEEADKTRLNAVPGITGAWQVMGRSQILDLKAVTKWDREYLREWSIFKDLKILLLTIPKVISGFGAY